MSSYLCIDNRESGGTKEEYDTIPCGHCQALLKLYRQGVNRFRDGGWCDTCREAICVGCLAKGICVPFMQWVEQWTRADHRKEIYRRLGYSGFGT